MGFVVGIIIALIILEAIGKALSSFFDFVSPFFVFIGTNIYLIMGITCLALAGALCVYYKSHPAQKHIEAYKSGKITRETAINRIVESVDFRQYRRVPSAYKSKIMEKRITALTKRIKAEKLFMDEVITQIKRKIS